jgi:protein associated with RNAse G/E
LMQEIQKQRERLEQRSCKSCLNNQTLKLSQSSLNLKIYPSKILHLLKTGMYKKKAVKAPFSMISWIKRPFKKLNMSFSTENANDFSTKISEIFVERLSTLSEQDFKVCDRDKVSLIMIDPHQVLSMGIN